MKLPLSLLKSFIDIDLGVVNLEETLTMLGLELDAVYAEKPPFSNVVVAEVKSARRHEKAEKLQVADVFDGHHTFQVVCGAPNCRAGIKTAFAKPGAHLIDDNGHLRTIEKTSIRGVESSGMLCSAKELSMYEESEGIVELPHDFKTGADCLPLLWDPVFDISLTPNLGHCMSALGVARELSAALQKPLHLHKPHLKEHGDSPFHATVQQFDLCPRYMARQIDQVKVAPSPFWLQRQLLAAGLRPINNVVDVTNYILLKTGQPLHAFDADAIEGKQIHVAPCHKATPFTALTGQECEIPPGALLISDAKKPLAVAGVMGGMNSAVTAETRSLLLEAASFDPISVRTTSKKMGLRTDSSLRFEKGVDPSSVAEFLDMAAELIAELTGGQILKGVIDCKQGPFKPRLISCRPARVNQILGTKLSNNEIKEIFHRLFFGVHEQGDTMAVEVPLFRGDISEEIDLIEEVARIYGYNHIERPLPRSTTPQIPHDPDYLFETKLRSRLVALGLQEFLTCDLISPKLANIAAELSQTPLLQTLHSKSEEYSILRPSLLPGILQVVRANLDQKNQQFAAFELGRIYNPAELPMMALVLTGKESPHHFDKKPSDIDFFDLKGLIENLLQSLRVHHPRFAPSIHPTFHPGRQADLFVGSMRIGSLGELHPEILAKLDIKQRVYYAEIGAHHLQALQSPPPKLIPLAQFPSSERDWTIPIDAKRHVSHLLEAIRASAPPLLERFDLIDLYRSEPKANVTLRFIYRDKSKTVSFEEVEAAHTRLIQEVLAKL